MHAMKTRAVPGLQPVVRARARARARARKTAGLGLRCGLPLTAKFTKDIAPDRQSVTCGACELASRPKVVAAPKVEKPADWTPEMETAELTGEEAPAPAPEVRVRREAVAGAPTQMR